MRGKRPGEKLRVFLFEAKTWEVKMGVFENLIGSGVCHQVVIGAGTKMNRPCNLLLGKSRCLRRKNKGRCPAGDGECVGRRSISRA